MRWAKKATTVVATMPPTKEPITAAARAWEALPRRAMMWPSNAVAIEELCPGVLSRMDVVAPPNCPP